MKALAIVFTIVFVVAAGWFLQKRLHPAKSPAKSIAVLPFANLSENKEDEYFSDGVTEDVITQLSKIADLKVISRTSVMPYKGTKKGLRQISKELEVEVVLEGSVRRSKDRIRIVGQLIDASTDEHIWADTFDRDLKDIFEVQSDVAQHIATALKAKLSPAEKERIEKAPTQNLTAYDYYLKGRENLLPLTKEATDNAVLLFKKALELDPNFALANAGLAEAYTHTTFYGSSETNFDTSIEIGKRAILLDPNLAEGYQTLGYAYQFKGWNRKALEMEQRALELNPNYARAAGLIGRILWNLGRLDEALHWVKKYHQLDPSSKLGYRYIADVHTMLGNYGEAKKWYERCIALDPTYLECIGNLMNPYIFEGKQQEVRAQEQKLLSIAPNFIGVHEAIRGAELFLGNYDRAAEHSKRLPENWLAQEDGYILMKTGNHREANRIFETTLKNNQDRLVAGSEGPYEFTAIASIHAMRGEKPEAYDWLQKGIDTGFVGYQTLRISPLWENLRGDTRFQQIVMQLQTRVEQMRRRAESE